MRDPAEEAGAVIRLAVQGVFLDLAGQSMAVDLEQSGGGGLLSVGRFERPNDQLLLAFLPGRQARGSRGSLGCGGHGAQVRFEVPGRDERAEAKGVDALDRVGQLAHVAGPVMGSKQSASVAGEANWHLTIIERVAVNDVCGQGVDVIAPIT